MRPLFPGWMRDDLQIVATCMSLDERVPPDVLAVTGASMATLLARIPFHGPMAAVRVGLLGDDFVLNPSYREIERSDLDLVVAGTPAGVVMVEAGANQLPEGDAIEAIDFGYEAVGELIKAQLNLLKDLGIEPVQAEEKAEDPILPAFLEKECGSGIAEVLQQFSGPEPSGAGKSPRRPLQASNATTLAQYIQWATTAVVGAATMPVSRMGDTRDEGSTPLPDLPPTEMDPIGDVGPMVW